MLGICNGFQVLCEAGLLPGVLRPNHAGRFVAPRRRGSRRAGELAVASRRDPGELLRIPVKHHDGAWTAPDEVAEEVEAADRYCFATSRIRTARAGTSRAVTNAEGNVLGLMPHPEHAVDELLGSVDGRTILQGLCELARRRAHALV